MLESVESCLIKLHGRPRGVRRPCHTRATAVIAAGAIGNRGSFYVHDGTAGVFVRHGRPLPIVPGDRVEVSGQAYRDASGEYELRASVIKQLGGGLEPRPRDVEPVDVVEGRHQGELVRARGEVVGARRSDTMLTIYLGPERMRVYWPLGGEAVLPPETPFIEKGALIEVTGIVRPRITDQSNPRQQIRLRTAEDILVLQPAPVLTARQWWTVFLMALAFAMGGALWAVMLRRRVEQKTEEVQTLVGELQEKVVALDAGNVELERAKKAAEVANRAKSEFLANMSHEMRSPLTVIVAVADLMLEEQTATKERREWLQMLDNAAGRLGTIVNDVLDLSKIEAGRVELKAEGFDPRGLVEEIEKAYAHKAAEKGLRLGHEFGEPLERHVVGDRGRIGQILENLVNNAVKFTPAGHVMVRLETDGEDGNARRLRIRVSDTGIGIHSDKLDEIFESFRQADNSATRAYGGTGLGLAISRDLAQLMGGEISVESELGVGSAFSVTVPVSMPDAGALNRGGESLSSGGSAEAYLPRTQNGSKILVAEDHPEVRLVVRRLLEAWGFTVVVATDGVEAVERFREERPNAILMDAHMPVTDGVAATARIRELEHETGGHTPIIALTSNALRGQREELLAAGLDDYVSKPIRRDLLRAALDKALRH